MGSRFFLGRLSRLLGRRRLLVGSTLAAALAMAALPIPAPYWLMAALLVIAGAGLGVGQPQQPAFAGPGVFWRSHQK
jgi:MFS family permease